MKMISCGRRHREKFTLYRTRIWSSATKVLDVGLLLGDQLDTLLPLFAESTAVSRKSDCTLQV